MDESIGSMVYLKQENYMSVQYVVDDRGHKTGVFLTLDEYEKMLDLIEELEDEKAYDVAMKAGEWTSLAKVEKELGL